MAEQPTRQLRPGGMAPKAPEKIGEQFVLPLSVGFVWTFVWAIRHHADARSADAIDDPGAPLEVGAHVVAGVVELGTRSRS